MEDTTVRDQPAPPPPPPPVPTPRRLLRRDEEGKIGGVCAGIADYLGVDATVVRIAAVLLAFAGPGVPAYLVSWLVMPKAPPGTPPNPVRHGPVFGDGNGAIAGVALLLFAALIVFDGGLFHREVLLPALLIGAGVWLLVRDGDVPAGAAPAPGDVGAGGSAVAPVTQGAPGAPEAPGQAGGAVTGSSTAVATWQGTTAPGTAPAASSTAAPAPSSRLAAVVLGVLALGGALLWLLAAGGAVDPDPGDVAAVALIGLGLGLVVGAWYGRARLLILPGLLLVLVLTAITAIDVPLEGGAGDRRYHPLTVADVRDEYRLGTGQLELDLSDVDLAGERLAVEASVGAGQLEVVVPEDATVVLSGRITVGQLVLPGQSERDAEGGLGIEEDVVLEGVPSGGTLELDLQVGLGQVEVHRG